MPAAGDIHRAPGIFPKVPITTKEFIIPVATPVGAKGSQEVGAAYERCSSNFQKLSEGFKAAVEGSKNKGFIDALDRFSADFKDLGEKTKNSYQATVFYSVALSTLVLGQPLLASKLGLRSKEEVEKQYPSVSFVSLTPKIAVQIGFLKPIKLTLKPQDPAKTHTTYGNKYITTSYYNLDKSLRGIVSGLLGTVVELPPGAVAGKSLYVITKVTEVTGRQSTAISLT